MKEEPAAKRTQMWLAQLGQYKHKPASVGGVAGGSPASTIGTDVTSAVATPIVSSTDAFTAGIISVVEIGRAHV